MFDEVCAYLVSEEQKKIWDEEGKGKMGNQPSSRGAKFQGLLDPNFEAK